MSLPTERWLDLLDPKLEEERSEITEDLLEAEGREFVAEVRSKLDHALAVLAVEAQQEADMYWNAHKSAREEASEDEQGRVGTRVRILGVSLVAEWYRNRFVEQVPGQKKTHALTHPHDKSGGFQFIQRTLDRHGAARQDCGNACDREADKQDSVLVLLPFG